MDMVINHSMRLTRRLILEEPTNWQGLCQAMQLSVPHLHNALTRVNSMVVCRKWIQQHITRVFAFLCTIIPISTDRDHAISTAQPFLHIDSADSSR